MCVAVCVSERVDGDLVVVVVVAVVLDQIKGTKEIMSGSGCSRDTE